jgi:mannose-6-phosphate isomerase-like protein (cupin superfamily)
MSGAVPIIRNDGEGERLWFYGGGVHTWKASAAETDGAFCLFEDFMTQGKTTPLHVHANEDEALYVLDGELRVHIDGKEHTVRPRGVAVAPRGVAHAFLVTSPIARVLTLQTPGSAESFYRGASEPAGADTDPSGPVDFDRVREAAERTNGMQIIGPPPFG